MREIIPRAWSKSHDAYCDFVTCDQKGTWAGWFKRCGIYLADKDIVLEFPTGIKDKNCKEIYEGDIMSDKTVVKFSNDPDEIGSCGCCVPRFFGSGFIISTDGRPEYLEVIGNIHKNPELLK